MSEPDQSSKIIPFTPREQLLILITCTVVTTLYAMTVTIANVALPRIQGALSATTDEIALVVTLNIIATAVATPVTGWLASRYSRRNILIAAIIFFTISTLLCGLATSLEALVFFRILQGIFAAPLAPISQSFLYTTYPRAQHGMAMAIFGTGRCDRPRHCPCDWRLSDRIPELALGFLHDCADGDSIFDRGDDFHQGPHPARKNTA
jgi:sugar phosphate permease